MSQNNPTETPRPRSKLLEKAKRFLRLVEKGSQTNDLAEEVGTDLANTDLANLAEFSEAAIAEMRKEDIEELESGLIHAFKKDGLKLEMVRQKIRELLERDQELIDKHIRAGGLRYETIDLREFRSELKEEMRREARYILQDERNWNQRTPKDKIAEYLNEKFK